MGQDQNNDLDIKPPKISASGPAPERTSFAYGSIVFGVLSLLAALLLNMTTFGTIMGAMGLGYALVARSSRRRLLVLTGAIVSLGGLLVSLSLAGMF
jgi:hypothetical protein